jgi:CRISPR/Cas system CMR-associated protein Cmr3 (group 5 of RAMP superfamily)
MNRYLFLSLMLIAGAGCGTPSANQKGSFVTPVAPAPLFTGMVIPPENEAGIQEFLKLLKLKHNHDACEMNLAAGYSFENSATEPGTKLKMNAITDREFYIYRMGFAHISKDGFFVVYVNRGVNQENGIWGYYALEGKTKLVKHELLWPNGSIATPFITNKENQRIYRFGRKENQNWNISEYEWDGHQFVLLDER